MTNKFSETLASLKQPKDRFGAQARNSDNGATETVFQSLGSICQEHKNNNAYPTNRHIQSIEEETVQPNTNTVKTTSKHPMEKYKL